MTDPSSIIVREAVAAEWSRAGARPCRKTRRKVIRKAVKAIRAFCGGAPYSLVRDEVLRIEEIERGQAARRDERDAETLFGSMA